MIDPSTSRSSPPASLAAAVVQLVARVGSRLDAMSLDLARDVGQVSRQATAIYRATPRAARLAQVAAGLLARHRWLRLGAAARGETGLSDADHRDLARRATAAAGELRGGIAKLGQLAACRPDLIGAVWARELAALQDDVPACDLAAIRARIEAELGAPIEAHFATLSAEPLAAASLAQVHAATLHDGTEVVVKVQVPGIEDAVAADIAALRAFAGAVGELPGLDLPTLTDELARALATELDYRAEAAALARFASPIAIAPRPLPALSTGRVLVMTRIAGASLTAHLEAAAPAARDRTLGQLVAEVASQILVRGEVHADPHPGNFLVTPDGALAVLDFGCTLSLAPAERAAYARLVLAIAGGDPATAATALAALGFVADEPAQLVALTGSLIAALRPGASVDQLDWHAAVAEQLAAARALGGLVVPRSFVLLGRVLATIAGLLAQYRPRIEIYPLIAAQLAAATLAR